MFSYIIHLLIIVVIFFATAFLFSLIKIRSIKKQLHNMEEVLDDIENGNGERKILMPANELTAPLAYKINKIMYAYEEQMIQHYLSEENNKQLMTNLSHDVRTPLTTLIGYLDAAYKGIVTGKEYNHYIQTARIKAHDLKDYIDILFDWFKLNSNDLVLEMEVLEITELTRDILKDWIPILGEKSLDFDILIPEKETLIKIDCDGYSRIINNIMQNAISHSQAANIKIELWEENHNLNIRFWDNGIGIAKEELPYIFDRLYKCDKGRSLKGSGLGLSVVKQIMEKMGGSIIAESKQNEYMEFILCLPLQG